MTRRLPTAVPPALGPFAAAAAPAVRDPEDRVLMPLPWGLCRALGARGLPVQGGDPEIIDGCILEIVRGRPAR